MSVSRVCVCVRKGVCSGNDAVSLAILGPYRPPTPLSVSVNQYCTVRSVIKHVHVLSHLMALISLLTNRVIISQQAVIKFNIRY